MDCDMAKLTQASRNFDQFIQFKKKFRIYRFHISGELVGHGDHMLDSVIYWVAESRCVTASVYML